MQTANLTQHKPDRATTSRIFREEKPVSGESLCGAQMLLQPGDGLVDTGHQTGPASLLRGSYFLRVVISAILTLMAVYPMG